MSKRLLVLFLTLQFFVKTGYPQIPGGINLLPAATELFSVVATPANSDGIILTEVAEQTFKKAYHVTIANNSGSGELNLKYAINAVVQKGDVMLLSFYTRTISSKRETGEAFFEARLDRFVDENYVWPPLLERGMSFGKEWTLTQIPFIAAMPVRQGELALVIRCGKMEQAFEMADLRLFNYQQTVAINDLPRSVVHYDGDEPTAPWRQAAADRIEKYRKGDLVIKVVDKKGQPVKGAMVEVKMTSPAFGWGTATSSQRLLDTRDTNSTIYRDTLLKYFNKVVLENEMKAKNWQRFNKKETTAGINWLHRNKIPVRGHVMVWPSWQHSPHLTRYKDDTAALRAAILTQIAEMTTAMKGQFIEWDVINEPYAHHSIIDLLGGNQLMLDWFNAARKHTTGVKLFLNDYTMFQGAGNNSPSEAFYNNVKYLKENGAAIEGIGEQGHIGGTPPGIEYVIERLNRFAALGLPIQITEFDITSDDDDFKARYMKDFMTAIFSHPATIGLVQWGFWAGQHWIPAGALWDKEWKLRSHGKVFTGLVSKTWATQASGATEKSGEYKTRAFNGAYDIVVSANGVKVKKELVLDAKGKCVTIQL